ncbi:hypothetical protein [Sandaracinus amylolyticus]|uniref:hypothetical protein n=1 Tax=Sandaracinus amylolyticus TaxID=927083 RepID=UPI001F3D8EDB|nr:hypothetical protein [Sandaracinus amylolyticus]UJR79084.1 Hypothetical protein I5071_11170 [Sandaracinus amylolyticus]
MSTERSTTTVPAGGEPKGTPIRSVLAVVAGWITLFVLGQLFLGVLASMMPGDIPSTEGAQPTERGLAMWLAGMLPNGIIAGLITARLAGWAPIAHAAVLGGIIGFFGMVSSDEARGLPAWFAIGRAFMPVVSIVLGGIAARAIEARRGKRA